MTKRKIDGERWERSRGRRNYRNCHRVDELPRMAGIKYILNKGGVTKPKFRYSPYSINKKWETIDMASHFLIV
ncbi:hypothetical protein Psfp_01417 [Pelotomaculum sp. FP]|uniref:hypothetical protein n=1 Tax=Pelotomaculum sp. FP TaxID=261474 RepID=UPI0010655A00|nr:hypothetical protein [Pelotomaculum sp. FP]TEB16392.1 hypothetical protein Psfp_01417 [Pelotomaculum sp. FP]